MSNIIIADPHTLCREALCDYIRNADQTMTIEGFGDYRTLRDYTQGAAADLVLIDHDLPGFERTLFARDFGHSKIGVMVSSHDGAMGLDDVHGVFPKSLSCKAFLSGIEDILAGKTFFPQADFRGGMPDMGMTLFTRSPQDFSLTGREKEVLAYLVKGASNKDIARALGLQVVTIKLHVRGICRKLKAANRTQAALIAKENGWG